jgi:beta-phosphoglucomutase-like phosphatase (HAD superfamily)
VLLLLDIDGTLVSGATQAHSEALHAALSEVHGIDSKRAKWDPSPAGRTDGEIARAILVGAGVEAVRIDERAAEVRERCCEIYARMPKTDLSHTVLPGVVDVISWLTTRDDVLLGLLTGNYEPVARLKLRQAARPARRCPASRAGARAAAASPTRAPTPSWLGTPRATSRVRAPTECDASRWPPAHSEPRIYRVPIAWWPTRASCVRC